MKLDSLILTPGLVDVDQVEEMLSGELPSDLIEEYYRFGSLVLSEAQNTASQIDGRWVFT